MEAQMNTGERSLVSAWLLLSTLGAALGIGLPPALPNAAAEQAATPTARTMPGQVTASYVVPTITCPGCAARIKASAKKDPGVLDVAVDVSTKHVTVAYDPSKTDPERIAEAIRKGGDTVLPGK